MLDEVHDELSFPTETQASRFKLHLLLPTIGDCSSPNAGVGSPASIRHIRCFRMVFGYQYQAKTLPWVALSYPVAEDEGCRVFYKESHNLGQLRHETNMDQSRNIMLSLGQYVS
jgi:hypothetical protein